MLNGSRVSSSLTLFNCKIHSNVNLNNLIWFVFVQLNLSWVNFNPTEFYTIQGHRQTIFFVGQNLLLPKTNNSSGCKEMQIEILIYFNFH